MTALEFPFPEIEAAIPPDQEPYEALLLTIERVADGPRTIRCLRLTRPVQASVLQSVREAVQKVKAQSADGVEQHVWGTSPQGDRPSYLTAGAVAYLTEIINGQTKRVRGNQRFDFNLKSPKLTRAYVLAARIPNGRWVLVLRRQEMVIDFAENKKRTPKAVIKGTFNQAGVLDLATELFAYDGQCDVLLWDDVALASDPEALDAVFATEQQIKAGVSPSVTEINKIVVNTDLTEKLVASQRGRHLLHSIKPGFADRLKKPEIRDRVQALGLDLVTVRDDGRISFDSNSVEALMQALHLLSDGFLESPITGDVYKVGSKHKWIPKRKVTSAVRPSGAITHLRSRNRSESIEEVRAQIEAEKVSYQILRHRKLIEIKVIKGELWAAEDGSPEENLIGDLPDAPQPTLSGEQEGPSGHAPEHSESAGRVRRGQAEPVRSRTAPEDE